MIETKKLNDATLRRITGSVGTIGTKGKFLRSTEWYAKFVFGQEFTFPFKYGIDLIRTKIRGVPIE